MIFRMVQKSGQIFLPFSHNARVWQTDRWTDWQTDGHLSHWYSTLAFHAARKKMNFRSVKHSLPGTFAPWNSHSVELSLPGTNVELLFCETFTLILLILPFFKVICYEKST